MVSVPLSSLDPSWFRKDGTVIRFVCPVCPSGHSIIVPWSPPSPLKTGCLWTKVSGSTFEDLTLSPSIDCTKPFEGVPATCRFHGFITDGQVSW